MLFASLNGTFNSEFGRAFFTVVVLFVVAALTTPVAPLAKIGAANATMEKQAMAFFINDIPFPPLLRI